MTNPEGNPKLEVRSGAPSEKAGFFVIRAFGFLRHSSFGLRIFLAFMVVSFSASAISAENKKSEKGQKAEKSEKADKADKADKAEKKEKAEASEASFTPLFNGQDLTGWHPRKENAHHAWKVVDGVLVNDLQPGEHGTDLVGDAKFWNFTVRYEYKVPEGSNSGFYLRGRQEIQILGDWKTAEPAMSGDGAIYNFKAPDVYASDRQGGWNSVEATVIGHKITVKINGKVVHDNVEFDKATVNELDQETETRGPFLLQGDHGAVSFRNIRVKELPQS